MKVAIGADWVGYDHKQALIKTLAELGYHVIDFGGSSSKANDYPDFAEAVGRAVADRRADMGILICGTGLGMSIAANKIPGVRAALCHDGFTTMRSRAHNDANILVLGALVVSIPHSEELVRLFLEADHEGGRHTPRLQKIKLLEDRDNAVSFPRSSNGQFKTCMALSPTPANFAPILYAGDLNAGIETAVAVGFDGIELNLRDSTQMDQDTFLENIRSVGLCVPSIGTGQSYFHDGLSLADPRSEIQAAVRERMRAHIDFASLLGAMVVLGSIRGKLDDSSEESRRACYTAACEATGELAEYAAARGVILTIEPINRYETNFLNTLAEADEFASAVNHPNIGLLADTFHMNIEEADMAKSLYRFAGKILHVHYADSNRLAPGMGHLDFQKFTQVLKEINYKGFLSAEIIPIPNSLEASRTWMETIRPHLSVDSLRGDQR